MTVTLECGCVFERAEFMPGLYISRYVVACDTLDHPYIRIDWTRVAAAYCMVLSERTPS